MEGRKVGKTIEKGGDGEEDTVENEDNDDADILEQEEQTWAEFVDLLCGTCSDTRLR